MLTRALVLGLFVAAIGVEAGAQPSLLLPLLLRLVIREKGDAA